MGGGGRTAKGKGKGKEPSQLTVKVNPTTYQVSLDPASGSLQAPPDVIAVQITLTSAGAYYPKVGVRKKDVVKAPSQIVDGDLDWLEDQTIASYAKKQGLQRAKEMVKQGLTTEQFTKITAKVPALAPDKTEGDFNFIKYSLTAIELAGNTDIIAKDGYLKAPKFLGQLVCTDPEDKISPATRKAQKAGASYVFPPKNFWELCVPKRLGKEAAPKSKNDEARERRSKLVRGLVGATFAAEATLGTITQRATTTEVKLSTTDKAKLQKLIVSLKKTIEMAEQGVSGLVTGVDLPDEYESALKKDAEDEDDDQEEANQEEGFPTGNC